MDLLKEIQAVIDELNETIYPYTIITSNSTYANLAKEHFPGLKVHLVPESYLPDSNMCYIVPRNVEKVYDTSNLYNLKEERICQYGSPETSMGTLADYLSKVSTNKKK